MSGSEELIAVMTDSKSSKNISFSYIFANIFLENRVRSMFKNEIEL